MDPAAVAAAVDNDAAAGALFNVIGSSALHIDASNRPSTPRDLVDGSPDGLLTETAALRLTRPARADPARLDPPAPTRPALTRPALTRPTWAGREPEPAPDPGGTFGAQDRSVGGCPAP
jgi:hypothetical protein